MTKTAILLALLLSSCKLGPFHDQPVEQPSAPLPDGWIGKGQADAGVADAAAPAERDQ